MFKCPYPTSGQQILRIHLANLAHVSIVILDVLPHRNRMRPRNVNRLWRVLSENRCCLFVPLALGVELGAEFVALLCQ